MRVTRTHFILIALISTELFIWPAFYNRFPILMPGDTRLYLRQALGWETFGTHPSGYGFFLRWFSFGLSLWIPLIIQSVLLNVLILAFMKRVLPNIQNKRCIVILLVLS